jgi:hypothetical protein
MLIPATLYIEHQSNSLTLLSFLLFSQEPNRAKEKHTKRRRKKVSFHDCTFLLLRANSEQEEQVFVLL